MQESYCFCDEVIDQLFAVLTGVEVVPHGHNEKHAGNGNDRHMTKI